VSRGDVTGPMHDVRYAQAPLIEIPLAAAELGAGFRIDVRPEQSARVSVVLEVLLTAVISRKEDNRVVGDAEFFQQFPNLAHLPVDQMDHRGVDFGIVGVFPPLVPRLIFVEQPGRIVVGNAPAAVRRSPAHVSEERFALVVANELFGLFDDAVLAERPAGFGVPRVARQRDLFAVADQVLRKKRVGVDLIVVTEEQVETCFSGTPDVPRPPTPHLPNPPVA
jgi:hypothetical protein